jgi:DNA-binding HxlR family transcriptional regulator
MDKYHLCPKFEAAFELLGKRWTGLIIQTLLSGQKRFSEIEDAIPNLSARMLTERFKELESYGIVIRHVYPETPVRIEYELTEKGRELQKAMEEIQKWSEKWN